MRAGSYVPLRWRVPFLTCTSMIFPIVLSTRRGKSDYATEAPRVSTLKKRMSESAHSIAGLASDLPGAPSAQGGAGPDSAHS